MHQNRIRVALVITELHPGGAEKALTSLACGLNRERFEPTVFSLRSRSYHKNLSLISQLEDAGIPLEFVDLTSIASVPFSIRKLARMLKQGSFDLLQSFMFHANLVGRLAGHRAGIPVICSGIRVAERACPWHLFFDRMTQSYVNSYICVSESVADFTRIQGKIAPEKISVIPNGIDLSGKVPDPCDTSFLRPARKHVAFIGRLSRQKGLDWLLKTVPRWLGKHDDWILYLIGEGEERAALEKRAAASDCSERIVFTGQHANIPALLKKLDLVVLPSRWEGMPNAILEAMAAGLPVLCSDAEGVLELLGPLSNHQVVHFGDSDGWVEKIDSLMADSTLRHQLGTLNQERIRQSYSLNDKIRMYETTWETYITETRNHKNIK